MPDRASLQVVMLLENNTYPQDVRVRLEAESLAGAGHRVTVFAPRGKQQPAREVLGGVRIRRYRLPPTPDSAAGIVAEYFAANVQLYARGIVALFRGADVVHMHNPPDTLFGVSLIARALGRDAVFDLHDVAPELFVTKFGESRVVAVLRWLERRSVRAATAVVVNNESMRDLACARSGVPPAQTTVVRNAPPASMLAQATTGRSGVLVDPRLIFVGSMESQDGVSDLPEILRSVREGHGLRGATLTVVGDGGRRAEVEREFARAGLAGAVRFTGRVPHGEIPGLLAESDICVEPAPPSELNHRCSMVKVYEYMAAARPIVSFRLREVERQGGDAIAYAEDGDGLEAFSAAVARLASDPEERRQRAEDLRRRVMGITWDASARSLLATYDRLGVA